MIALFPANAPLSWSWDLTNVGPTKSLTALAGFSLRVARIGGSCQQFQLCKEMEGTRPVWRNCLVFTCNSTHNFSSICFLVEIFTPDLRTPLKPNFWRDNFWYFDSHWVTINLKMNLGDIPPMFQAGGIPFLGGGNSNIFYFHPDPWGNDPIWRAYFSNGLKPPTIVFLWASIIFGHQIRSFFGALVVLPIFLPSELAQGKPLGKGSFGVVKRAYVDSSDGNMWWYAEVQGVSYTWEFAWFLEVLRGGCNFGAKQNLEAPNGKGIRTYTKLYPTRLCESYFVICI